MAEITKYLYDGAAAAYDYLPGMPGMPSLAPTPMDRVARLVGDGLEGVPRVGNIAITADSARVGVQSGICFFKATNPLARACFGAGAVCGLAGSACSGASAFSNYMGFSPLGIAGDLAGRACYRLGKYSLRVGNITDGNMTALAEVPC